MTSGRGEAAEWLTRFATAYEAAARVALYPGSLNLRLSAELDWHDERWTSHQTRFSLRDHGGERDIVLLPCILTFAPRLSAFLWATTRAIEASPRTRLVEVVAPRHLRAAFALHDGAPCTFILPG